MQQEAIDQPVQSDVEQLDAAGDDSGRSEESLRDDLDTVLQDDSKPIVERFEHLNGVVRDALADAFSKRDASETVEVSKDLAGHVVDLLSKDDGAAADLCEVVGHDSHVFTHSANVAYYSVMLARKLGIRGDEDLKAIAAGALLHDLGTLKMVADTISKPYRLSEANLAEIRRHPTIGFRMLSRRNDLSYGQLMMVYQHHERLNGSGYPVRATGEEIHEWARLCAVADVYEALTSKRPYRRAFSQEQALEILDQEAGTRLDEGMVKCLKAIITRS